MNKCPKCGAIGNKGKTLGFIFYCPNPECDIDYFDSKGREWEYTTEGQLVKKEQLAEKGEIKVSQKEKIKQAFTRDDLLEELARTSGVAIAKKLDVNSGQISVVCKEYEITSVDIDRKRAELAGDKITTEHEPEVIINPTPEQVEKFFVDTDQHPPADENKETKIVEKAINPDTMPEEELPEEEIFERYYIIEGEEKCSKDYPLEAALEKIRTEYSMQQCENVHLVKETRIIKEIPFVVAMSVTVAQ